MALSRDRDCNGLEGMAVSRDRDCNGLDCMSSAGCEFCEFFAFSMGNEFCKSCEFLRLKGRFPGTMPTGSGLGVEELEGTLRV